MKNVVTRVTRCKMQQPLTGTWNFACFLVGYSLVTVLLLAYSAFHEVPNQRR